MTPTLTGRRPAGDGPGPDDPQGGDRPDHGGWAAPPPPVVEDLATRALLDRPLTPVLATLMTVVGVLLVAIGAAFGPLTGVLALAAVAYGLSMVRSPLFAVLVLVAVVPVTSGLARGMPVPGLKIAEVLVAAVAVLVLVLGQRTLAARWGAVDWAALAYVVVNAALVGANAVWHEAGATAGEALAIIGSPLLFILLYRAVATAVRTDAARATALRLLLWASIPVSVLALLQRAFPPVHDLLVVLTDTGVFSTPGYDPVLRVSSVFPIWHSLGAYLLVVVVLAAALLLDADQRVLSRAWLWTVLVPAAAALVLTLTVAIGGGAVLGLALVGIAYGRARRVVTAVAVGGVVAALLFRPLIQERIDEQVVQSPAGRASVLPETIATRVEVWTEQYLPAMSGHFLRGYGQDAPPGIIWEHTESQYFTFLLRGGVPLLLVFLGLLAVVWVAARRHEADPARRPLARAVRALVVVFAVICLIFPYFTSNGMSHITWILWGLLFAPPLDPPGTDPDAAADGPAHSVPDGHHAPEEVTSRA